MKYRKRPVRVFAQLDAGFDVVRPQRAWRQLQPAAIADDGVVACDGPLPLDAKDLGEQHRSGGNECALRNLRRAGKTRIMRRIIELANETIGGHDVGGPRKAEVFWQPIQQRAKQALPAAPAVPRGGRSMLDAKPLERAPHLGETLFVDRLAGLGREKVMAAAISVEARRQGLRREHFEQSLKCRDGAFLLDQKG